MNVHHTKYIGDLAVARVLADLIEKQWFVMQPCISEHLPFDLLAYRIVEGKPEYLRIQVKAANEFRTDAAPGRKGVRYTGDTIDLFATYLRDVGVCAYFPIALCGASYTCLTTKVPNSANEFWWYEDFLEPNASIEGRVKSNFRRFKEKLDYVPRPRIATKKSVEAVEALANPKKERYPSPAMLQKMVWEESFVSLGNKFDVSDVAIRKHCKSLNLLLPPQGYFAMSDASRELIRKKFEESTNIC
jgi:hypothetical protein